MEKPKNMPLVDQFSKEWCWWKCLEWSHHVDKVNIVLNITREGLRKLKSLLDREFFKNPDLSRRMYTQPTMILRLLQISRNDQ